MISAIIHYSSIDKMFLETNINQCLKFSDDIIVLMYDRLFDGTPEKIDELIFTKNLVESYDNCKFFVLELDLTIKKPRTHHNLLRNMGVNLAKNDWIFQLDSDEIVSDEFYDWFHNINTKANGYWFTSNWYFREPIYKAKQTEAQGLLIKKEYAMVDVNDPNEQERAQCIFKFPNIINGNTNKILSMTGKPMIDHYSWVRTKENMIAKVKNWGHRSDRSWVELVNEEFSRDFNGKDFIHGYEYEIVDNKYNLKL